MRWSWILAVALALSLSSQALRAEQLRAPGNVNKALGSRQSAALTTKAVLANLRGNPREAVALAEQAIQAAPRAPWPYYNKGMALGSLNETDEAVAAMTAAEQRFAGADRWGQSIAIWGRAHILAQAGRCDEAKRAYDDYAAFVRGADDAAAELAGQYAAQCRPRTPAPTE